MTRNLVLAATLGALLAAAGGAVGYTFARRAGFAGAGVDSVKNFSLLDLEGRYFELGRQRTKAVVLVSFGIGCPIAEKNVPLLEALRIKFEPLGVGFYLLDANPRDDLPALREEVARLGIKIPVLRDARQSVVRTLGVTRTAEALLIRTSDSALLYRGAVDDRLSFGGDRRAASHGWLESAVASFLRGEAVETPRTKPDGCLIEGAGQASRPTFTGGVAAVMRERCNRCHRPGGSSPPANLVSYEDVKNWTAMIEETILTHRMPPWAPNPEFQKFNGDLSLGAEEERMLLDWIRSGAPRGEGKEPPLGPPPGASRPFRPSLFFRSGPVTVQASTGQRWAYLPVIDSAETDLWVTGIRINTGDRTLVHESLYVLPRLPDLTHSEKGLMLDDDKMLFRVNLLLSGRTGILFPKGVGMKVPRGASLLLEQHLYPSTKSEEVSLEALVEVARDPSKLRQMHYDIASVRDFEVPAGAAGYEVRGTWRAPRDLWLVSVLPHMHMHGASAMAWIRRPGARSSETLLSIPDFSFTHGQTYAYEKPLFVPAGSEIGFTSVFDNSAGNPHRLPYDRPLRFGPDTEKNEMADLVLYSY